MTRRYVWPEGHWDWPIKITHKHGLRCDDLMFIGGQIDVDTHGTVRHPHDVAVQADKVVDYIVTVLGELGADLSHLVKVVAFCADPDGTAMPLIRAVLEQRLPPATRPALTLLPVKYLAYPAMMVEIEVIASRRPLRRQAAGPFPAAVRTGELILAGAQDIDPAHPGRAIAALDAALAPLGADAQDVVKLGVLVERELARASLTPILQAIAGRLSAPVALHVLPVPPVPGLSPLRVEAFAMRGVDGARLERQATEAGGAGFAVAPFVNAVRCGGMVFIGSQLPTTADGAIAEGVVAQTHAAMGHMKAAAAAFGLGLDDLVKVNAFYDGDGTYDDLHKNLAIRSTYYQDPGPTTTGIPVAGMILPGQAIQIDGLGMDDRGDPRVFGPVAP
ncbi:RidA family protein [Zavarzinia sp. CC-PAN008]|uniref:RidA family protein n=1 Tax=Zavarzinia sp. CC-PAN008 TaxID=3243332 RepID=UPI003F7479F6